MRDGAEPMQPARGEDDDFATTSLDAPGDGPDLIARAPVAVWRSGRARGAATLGVTALLVVVVAVGLFARATSDPAGAAATLLGLPSPTPAATLTPGANLIFASDGAPWGTLTIDGRRMPTEDMLGEGFKVSRGAHHLVYQARYFPTLRCVFSAPPAASDTCPIDTSTAANQFLLDHGSGRILDLGSTGLTLQDDQRAALFQLADSILAAQSSTVTIAPGDRYLDDQGHVVTATAPLRFTVTLALGVSEPPGAMTSCEQFCSDPNFLGGRQIYDQQWFTHVRVTSSWAITDASGRRITSLGYLVGQPHLGMGPLIVGVQLTSSGWKISGLGQQVNAAVSNAAMMAASQLMQAASNVGYSLSFEEGLNPSQGCVMGVEFGGKRAQLLWRFGVLLALDSNTRHVFPQLPVANAAEQALAARLVQQSPLSQP